MTLASVGAVAQEAPSGRGFSLAPSLSVIQTVTDNVNPGSGQKRSDAITQLSPGVRWSSNAGRVQGSVDYTLTGVLYARQDEANDIQQSLSAQLRAEAIENFLYVDSRASISQQSISAFGVQAPTAALANGNRTEVSSFTVSPYLRGMVSQALSYEVRLNYMLTRSSDSDNGDSTLTGASARFGPGYASARLFWNIDLSHQTVDFRAGHGTESQRLIGSLGFRAAPDLTFSVRAGREANTALTSESQSYSTSGWSVNWVPSERTLVSIDRDQRFFGSAYAVRLEYRTPRSVWRLVGSRSVSGDEANAGSGGGSTVTVYDLLFQQFASLAPDPIQREALVNAYLRDNGLDRSALAANGFLTSAATVDRRNEFSFALLALRSSVIVSIFEGSSRRLDPLVRVIDNLSNGNEIKQHGVIINASHRLTPRSAVNAGLSVQDTSSSVGLERSRLRSFTVTWSNQLALRATSSVGVRRALFDSSTQPYSETAVFATLSFSF